MLTVYTARNLVCVAWVQILVNMEMEDYTKVTFRAILCKLSLVNRLINSVG